MVRHSLANAILKDVMNAHAPGTFRLVSIWGKDATQTQRAKIGAIFTRDNLYCSVVYSTSSTSGRWALGDRLTGPLWFGHPVSFHIQRMKQGCGSVDGFGLHKVG